MLEYRIGEKQTIQFRTDMILIIDEVDESAKILRVNASIRDKLAKAIENAINTTKVTRFAIGSISVSIWRNGFINFLFRSRCYNLKMTISTSDVLEILMLYSPSTAAKYDPESFYEEDDDDDDWDEDEDEDYGDEDEDYSGQLLHPTFDDLGINYQENDRSFEREFNYNAKFKKENHYENYSDAVRSFNAAMNNASEDVRLELLKDKLTNLNADACLLKIRNKVSEIDDVISSYYNEVDKIREIKNEDSSTSTETEKIRAAEEEYRERFSSEDIIDLS